MPKKNQKQFEKQQQMMKAKQQQRQTRKQLKKQRGQARALKGYAKHFQEFQEEVNQLGLQIRDVEGDGNCLFRSIADSLHGDERHHKQLRKLAVQTMSENKDFFSLFIEDDMTFEQYLKEMGSDGEWGGNLELQALAQSLEINFFIHMKGRPCMIIQSMTDDRSLKEKDSVHLAYHLIENVAEHYSSIRMLGDDSNERALPISLDIFEGILDTFEQAPLGNEEFPDFQEDEYEDPEEREYMQALKEQEEAEKAAKEAEKAREVANNYQLKQKKNQKCNCGSKKTYKDCCMQFDIQKQQQKGQEQQQQPPQQQQGSSVKKQAVFI